MADGRPCRRSASVSSRQSGQWEYDVTACAVLRFANGGLGRATVTLEAAAPYRFGIRVFGTHGTILNNTVCIPAEHGGEYIEHCTQQVDVTYLPFDRVATDFVQNVATGADSHAALEHTADLFRLAIDTDTAARRHQSIRRNARTEVRREPAWTSLDHRGIGRHRRGDGSKARG